MRAVVLPLLALLSACTPDRGEVRGWTSADHDQPEGRGRQERPPASKEDTSAALADTVWRKNCATCHGPEGRGDGPQGPMVQAPDLTRADWQGKTTDEDLAKVIRQGKNRMPSFPDLPDSLVQGLIKRIRAARAAE